MICKHCNKEIELVDKFLWIHKSKFVRCGRTPENLKGLNSFAKPSYFKTYYSQLSQIDHLETIQIP